MLSIWTRGHAAITLDLGSINYLKLFLDSNRNQKGRGKQSHCNFIIFFGKEEEEKDVRAQRPSRRQRARLYFIQAIPTDRKARSCVYCGPRQAYRWPYGSPGPGTGQHKHDMARHPVPCLPALHAAPAAHTRHVALSTVPGRHDDTRWPGVSVPGVPRSSAGAAADAASSPADSREGGATSNRGRKEARKPDGKAEKEIRDVLQGSCRRGRREATTWGMVVCDGRRGWRGRDSGVREGGGGVREERSGLGVREGRRGVA